MAQPLADLMSISNRLQPAARHVRFPGETTMPASPASPVHALQAAVHDAWTGSDEAEKPRPGLGFCIVATISLMFWAGITLFVF